MTTNPTARWISLPAATVDDLEAELSRRREEDKRAAAAAAEQKRELSRRRKDLANHVPGMVRGWRHQLAALTKPEEARPSPDLRNAARGGLLRSDWLPVLERDVVCAQLQEISRQAGELLTELEGIGEVSESLRGDVDAVECAAFSAAWARIYDLAGVTR